MLFAPTEKDMYPEPQEYRVQPAATISATSSKANSVPASSPACARW